MHCPRCGQQQVTEAVRFCSRCGFLLEGITQLLASGGMLPAIQEAVGTKQVSPRGKGVRQGAALLLAGAVLVPVLGVFYSYLGFPPEMIIALAALLCFLGGPLRMLYAAIFEEGAPKRLYAAPPPAYVVPAMMAPPGASARGGMLPPPAANPASAWRSPQQSGEIASPPSVTDNTTRFLEKPEPKGD